MSVAAQLAQPEAAQAVQLPVQYQLGNNETAYAQSCPADSYLCAGQCWTCGAGWVVSCYNNNPYCCPTSYPTYCGRTSTCWADSNQCNNAIQCNGQWWACTPGTAKPTCYNNQVYCCNADTPYYWGGSCHKCQEAYPNECGGNCYGNCANNGAYTCYNGQAKCCPSGYPNYCGRNDLCWTQSWMCDESVSCGGSWQVCGSSSDVEYCDNGQLKCCPSDKPYYWEGSCHACEAAYPYPCAGQCFRCEPDTAWVVNCVNGQTYCCSPDTPYYWNGQCQACTQDYPNRCDNQCWNCVNANDVFTCYNNQAKCCPSGWPFYCGRIDRCTQNSNQCDAAQKCGNEGWTVCTSPSFPHWNCRNDGVSRCCPSGYPYLWNSDYLCHTTQEQQKCAVPDGSSANCDCDSDAECRQADPSRPFCGETYNERTPQGFHACLNTKPKFCGDGSCEGSEDYKNCISDCAQNAPKGTISVDVYYSSGANANKPISGAYVSLDGISKGTTDKDGKLSFQASYGSRSVKVNCPDNSFCGEKSVGVDGAEHVSFGCGCNLVGDSDGDGYTDEDERLLGTDPNDKNENYASVFSSFEHPKSCFDILGLIGLVWKNKDNLIQANDVTIAALNTSAVMAADLSTSPLAVVEALSAPEILADAEVVPIEVTLMEALETSEAVGGFFTDNGAVLVMTDYNTSTTAIIAVAATCVGWSIGGIYGAGTGVKDDVVGIWELLQGLWYAATHITEIPKIVGDVVGLIRGIPELFGKAGEIFHDAMMGVLEKGSSITQKTGLFKSDRQAYLQFQLGFLNGFVTGYVLEQIAATFIGAGAILKGIKAAGFAGKTGKTLKLSKILADITQKYGGEVASAVKNLKYADKIADWTEAEREALTRLVKLKHKIWLGEISEAEAKAATKNIGKLADTDIDNLLKTKLGQHTLKAADATDDLLAKQSKLISKWGAKKADEVVTKCSLFIFCDTGRISDLNKILKAMPDGIVDDLSHEKAVKFLGNKQVIKGSEELVKSIDKAALAKFANSADNFEDMANAAGRISDRYGSLDNFYPALKSCLGVAAICSPADIEKITNDLKALGHDVVKLEGKFRKQAVERLYDAVKLGAADLSKISPESVARIMKGYGKVNPFDAGEQTLVKILKAPGKQTVVGTEKVDGVFILRKGKMVAKKNEELWGVDHIKDKHGNKLNEQFGKTLDDDDIKNIAEKVMDDATLPKTVKSTDLDIKEAVEKMIIYNGKEKKVRVAYFIKADYGGIPGDIATVFIPD